MTWERPGVVPEAGVEPARPDGQGILSPRRLPFRHSGGGDSTVCLGIEWRRRWESNPRIRVLQTLALPLGYVAELPRGAKRHARPGEAVCRESRSYWKERLGAGNGI